MSFVGQEYGTGYHCLRETVAWPAQNGWYRIKCNCRGEIVIYDSKKNLVDFVSNIYNWLI